jgi:hypothetical protein
MSNHDEFSGRVRGFLGDVGSISLPPEAVADSARLVDEGEPGEALRRLAWVIVRGNHRVPQWVVDQWSALVRELVPLGLSTGERFPYSLPARVEDSEPATRPLASVDPGGRKGLLIALDRDERIAISHRLLLWGFPSWFWYQVDDKYELLLDEYEGEDLSPELVLSFATELTDAKARADFPSELTAEVDRLVDFLRTAAARGSQIEIDL